MAVIRTRLHVAADGTISGHAPPTLPPGEHDAEIAVTPVEPSHNERRRRDAVRAVQEKVARLPVLDPRPPKAILGYDQSGQFD